MPTIPEAAQEAVEAVKHPRALLGSAIHKARETIIGSGSIKQELKEVGSAYADIPGNVIRKPLHALGHLLMLNPIDATKELAEGTINVMGDVVKIGTAPARLASAGVAGTAHLAAETAKLPFKGVKAIAESPFKVWDMMDKGTDKLFGYVDKLEAWDKAG